MDGPVTVLLIGSAGRMGRMVQRGFADDPRFTLRLAADEAEFARALDAPEAELALDLTVAGLGADHGRRLLEAGLRPVIGTSGVSPEENAELDELARSRGLGGLVVPNFSLGVACLQRAARMAAEHFTRAEIIELHHAAKRDAPSGTALDTAERLGALWGRAPASIPVHSVRLPGLTAHQEILFGGEGETLSLRHDLQSRDAFLPGIRLALRHARTALGVGRGLEVALAGDPGRA